MVGLNSAIQPRVPRNLFIQAHASHCTAAKHPAQPRQPRGRLVACCNHRTRSRATYVASTATATTAPSICGARASAAPPHLAGLHLAPLHRATPVGAWAVLLPGRAGQAQASVAVARTDFKDLPSRKHVRRGA